MTLLVFGSLNMDLVIKTQRLPVMGETLRGENFFTAPGGKGANQAVAAARLGMATQMIGRVGNDSFGTQLIASLQHSGVIANGIFIDNEAATGVAVITTDNTGHNSIIIIAGANGRVDNTDVQRLQQCFPNTGTLLLQLEIPLTAVETAAIAAKKAGIRVILDPAPAPQDIPAPLYQHTDIITPNQIEASQLVGFSVHNPETATAAAKELCRRGCGTAIVKLGEQGVCCATDTDSFFIPAFAISAVDTTAAGDAFNAALAAGLSQGLPLRQAVIWGAGAGALAATKAGAQPSMPNRPSLEAFLRQNQQWE